MENRSAPIAVTSSVDSIREGLRSLADLPIGFSARIVAVSGTGHIARRLMEMGFVPGAPVSVIRQAPFGDPLEVRVRSCHLAVRRAEARTIVVGDS